jgi:hypothetical protein
MRFNQVTLGQSNKLELFGLAQCITQIAMHENATVKLRILPNG